MSGKNLIPTTSGHIVILWSEWRSKMVFFWSVVIFGDLSFFQWSHYDLEIHFGDQKCYIHQYPMQFKQQKNIVLKVQIAIS